LTTWTASNNAFFDQVGTYTATINADQTATNITIRNGALTFAGTNRISSNSLTIDSGASLTAASDRFLKVGTTTLTVNGTLTQTAAVAANTQRVIIAGGNGNIVFSGGLRTGGDFNFAGDISGTGSIVTDAAGLFTLSGNNTFAGDMLIRSGNTIRVGSATALSANSFLRIGGGTNIIELTGANFSRTLGNSAGNVRFHAGADGAGSSGFAAVNADRTVALNGTVTWGAGLFNQANFHLQLLHIVFQKSYAIVIYQIKHKPYLMLYLLY
jgi:autotransporter-associated beta strand protein